MGDPHIDRTAAIALAVVFAALIAFSVYVVML